MSANTPAGRDRTTRLGRTLVASVFVAGAVAAIAMRPAPEAANVADGVHPAFLHTPAADLSVPSAEQVFTSPELVEAETSPTF